MQLPLLIAGAALCAAAGVGMYTDHLADVAAKTAALRAEAELSEGMMLPKTPSGVLSSLHRRLTYATSDSDAKPTCWLMTPQAQQQFADAHQARDCRVAAQKLQAQITDKNRYPRFEHDEKRDEVIHGDDGTMDGCAVTWTRSFLDPSDTRDPGPRLGRLTMHRVAGIGFKITGVQPCPPREPTPPAATTAAPPPAGSPAIPTPAPPAEVTAAPNLLPGYGPALPGILASRIATNDPSACTFFTDAGRREFAAALKVADCPAAVAAMHARVADPELYANPTGATSAAGSADRTIVDGCKLVWRRFNGPPTPPGPQIGRLELEQPPGRVGYLIAGYRAC